MSAGFVPPGETGAAGAPRPRLPRLEKGVPRTTLRLHRPHHLPLGGLPALREDDMMD
jgi:hypothetical protein